MFSISNKHKSTNKCKSPCTLFMKWAIQRTLHTHRKDSFLIWIRNKLSIRLSYIMFVLHIFKYWLSLFRHLFSSKIKSLFSRIKSSETMRSIEFHTAKHDDLINMILKDIVISDAQFIVLISLSVCVYSNKKNFKKMC